jgi:hypothetical protein
MHARVCRATACSTERSRPALGPQRCSQSINHSVMQDAILPTPQYSTMSVSTRLSVSSRLYASTWKISTLPTNDCRRGRVASSAASAPTLSHSKKVTSRASVRSCRPSHLTDTPHLSDWAISVSSYDSYHPPPSLMTSSACRPPLLRLERITRTLVESSSSMPCSE